MAYDRLDVGEGLRESIQGGPWEGAGTRLDRLGSADVIRKRQNVCDRFLVKFACGESVEIAMLVRMALWICSAKSLAFKSCKKGKGD